MGAQWKNANKSANAAQKGAIVFKLTKEIQVAARLGQPDPEYNPRLRAAIEAARKHSVTKDTIERAIKKGAGLDKDASTFEVVTYEGFGPHKVPVIVECLTDNKNRTASAVKLVFRSGQMSGVAWMFDRMGIVEATHNDANLDLESVAIEVGAQYVEELEKTQNQISAQFFTDVGDVDTVNRELLKTNWQVTKAELGYRPKNLVDLSPEQEKEVVAFLQEVDGLDDVHRVYVAVK